MRSVNNGILSITFTVLLCNCGAGHEEDHAETAASDTLHYVVPFDSLGIESGDSLYMLGDIWAASYTLDFNIAVLDRTLSGVRFYSSDGVHLYDFIPSGEGPGEFSSLDCMCIDSDGNLMLGGYYDRKVALYNADLDFIREIIYGTARVGPVKMAPGTDSTFVLMNSVLKNDSVGTEIALFRDRDQPLVDYRTRMVAYTPDVNYQAQTGMVFTTSNEGRVFIADRVTDQYWITCYSQQGDSLFEFGFEDYEPVLKPDSLVESQRSRALDQYVRYYGTSEGFSFDPMYDYYMPITSLAVDSLDRIWVRGEENSSIADVFSPDGEFLYTCQGVFPDWQESDGFNLRINDRGILADPRNPAQYPVVYQMREKIQIIPR